MKKCLTSASDGDIIIDTKVRTGIGDMRVPHHFFWKELDTRLELGECPEFFFCYHNLSGLKIRCYMP